MYMPIYSGSEIPQSPTGRLCGPRNKRHLEGWFAGASAIQPLKPFDHRRSAGSPGESHKVLLIELATKPVPGGDRCNQCGGACEGYAFRFRTPGSRFRLLDVYVWHLFEQL